MTLWQILQEEEAEKQGFYSYCFRILPLEKTGKSCISFPSDFLAKYQKLGGLNNKNCLLSHGSTGWKFGVNQSRAVLPFETCRGIFPCLFLAPGCLQVFRGVPWLLDTPLPSSALTRQNLTLCLHIVFPPCAYVLRSKYLLFIRVAIMLDQCLH